LDKKFLAILLTLFMLIQPFISLTDLSTTDRLNATGRSTEPDMMVVEITTTLGGAFENAGTNYLSTATHQISVNITNQGLTSAESRLRVLYKSAPGAVATEVNAGGTAVELDPFEFQTLVFSYAVSITGPGQSFSATLESATGEVDNSNNFATLDFDVENIESGEFLGVDIPNQSFPPPRLAPGPTSYEAVVRNSGNIPVTADFEVTFTSLADGTVIQHSATSTVINPGTLEYPSTAEILGITFDSSSMTGNWELTSTVTFSGIGSVVEDLGSRIVVFSQYRAEIIAAPDQSVVPGSSTMLTFLITNTGDLVDTYSISVEDTQGWASAAIPPVVNLNPGASGATAIIVSVPADEQRSNATRIFVNLTALSDGYQLSANNLVMAGHLLLASVTPSISLAVVPVQPGNMTPIPFSIKNVGNSPGSFNLTCGFGGPVEGWEIELLSQKTSVLSPGENESAILQIYPPALSNPLNPAHQLTQGTQLVVWVQATASGGGVPVTGQADIEVQPVIAVDPAIDSLEYILSEGESRYGETIQAIDFGIEMRHNLIDDPEDTSGATLSVGNLAFTPADGTGGALESTRWNASITPDSHAAPLVDANGEPVFSALSVLQPSSDGLGPLAGILEVPVTAQISDTTGIVVDTSPVTRTVRYVIPKFHSVVIDELDLQNVNPGEATTFNLSISNKGNGLANYSLLVDSSDGWIVTLSKSSLEISPEMYDWPTLSGVHSENFTMTVTAPLGTLENTVENIVITVLDSDTGDNLLVHQSPVTVGKQVSAILTPSVVNVNVSYLGDVITLLKVNNTGNTLSEFDINTTVQNGDPIDITILGSEQFILKSGRTQDLRFQVTALEGASYDTTYEIGVEITSGEDISLNGTIIVQVQQWHNLDVTLPEIEVTPGENESISYWASNFGNLIENVNVGVYLETGWNVTLEPLSHQIPIDASHAGSFVIQVPPISEENMLYNGEEFTLWFSLKNSSTGEELYNSTNIVKVRPFFALEVKEWKEEILFLPGDEKEITAVLKNSGNTDIVVNVSAKLENSQWQITQPPQSAFTLSLGQEVLVSMAVRASGDNYYWREVGVLELNVTPVDLDVVGSGEHSANLIVERILDSNHSVFGQATTIEIPWSHVPSEQEFQASNYPASPNYILELLSSERFLNLSNLQLDNESHYDWTFTLADSDDGAVALMKNVKIDLKPRSKNTQTPALQIIVNASSVEGVLPGDGYNLTLKLTHPTDETSTIIKVIISLDNFADPFVKSISFQEGLSAIGEGESGQIVSVIRNGGTATTPYLEVELNCNDRVQLLSESSKIKQISEMPQSTETTLTWDVNVLRLEWWQTSEKVDCIVSLISTGAEGNNVENDLLAMDASVVSWSPVTQFVSVGIVMGLFILTALLLQLGRDREKLRQLSAYSGAALLGMVFHLSEWIFLGPILLVLVVIWLIYNAYSASDELQIIHADYQRARLGQTTLFTEHFRRLKKSRQQLTFIFTLPLLGFLMTILGFPPLLSADILNILSLILIVGITAIMISAVLKYIDKLYGQVYSRLTLVQARLRSIERSLGDPARLLNEIANIDLEAVVEQAEGGDSDV
tara:strand:- start:151 stop:4893 length:4743 start_codon:yes stop_codon:yes gene_type:complete